MALWVEGYNHRIYKNIGLPTKYFFSWILYLHPSTKRVITPMFNSKSNWKIAMPNIIFYSRAFHRFPQNMYKWHMTCVHKCVLKLVIFEVQKVQKPYLLDLADTSPHLGTSGMATEQGTCLTPRGQFCQKRNARGHLWVFIIGWPESQKKYIHYIRAKNWTLKFIKMQLRKSI